ncbi:phosphoribosylamine--glycine ligase [Corynebacterium pseudogenitalium]|uniref:phosphoribosylamine--glycine ligase n=1 Tax=Corynebacterium pseudogenitalium TaxID=38303 RepID=UPI003B9FB6B4
MRILVIGSGGREHALLKGLAGHELTVAPGNAGMASLAEVRSVDVASPESVVELAKDVDAELVVIGPEVPLVAGAVDALQAAGIPAFGPTKAAAQLEGSKAFAKDVMAAAGVATARAQRVESIEEIDAAIEAFGPHYVVKDDGLAGGKGVVVTLDAAEALAHARAVIEAGNPVLFESFLEGPEVSLFCLVDGETVVPLLPAQDHKRAYDNDEGPNTGGMGAYTPLPWLPEGGVDRIVDEIARPVAREMVTRGIPYQGLLYVGAAWGPEGPSVVEFNARFGDPETQPVLSLLRTPLVDVLYAVATGSLDTLPPLEWEDGYAATVVLAAKDYPEHPKTGDVIRGADLDNPDVVLHAGTATKDGGYVSAGGRVLNVLGKGVTLQDAVDAAYQVIEQISLEGSFYRKDIGRRAIEGEIRI